MFSCAGPVVSNKIQLGGKHETCQHSRSLDFPLRESMPVVDYFLSWVSKMENRRLISDDIDQPSAPKLSASTSHQLIA